MRPNTGSVQSSHSRIARESPDDPALVQENLVQLTHRTGHDFLGTRRDPFVSFLARPTSYH